MLVVILAAIQTQLQTARARLTKGMQLMRSLVSAICVVCLQKRGLAGGRGIGHLVLRQCVVVWASPAP